MRETTDAEKNMSPGTTTGTSRREFLAAAAAISGPLLVSPKVAFGSQANSRLTIGSIGCGGRGTWIADLFQKHGGYEVVAAADYFQDRVDEFAAKIGVPAERRFTGLDGYERLLAGKLDAVVIESPPCFHPPQAAAAVEAGKHVYLAKPIAVDVPGCRSVEQSGRKATEKKLAFLIDFQTRTDAFYREAVKRTQYGDIGRIVSGEATYFCGPTWGDQAKWLLEKPNDPEMRLRAWGLDRALSGDVITEQNIHSLDVATWVLDAAPLSAVGTGGRSRKAGSCWDHFHVVFSFPQDVIVSFSSKQLGDGWDDIGFRAFGTDGTLDTHYFGETSIKGKLPYRGGHNPNLYGDGASANIAAFHAAVSARRLQQPDRGAQRAQQPDHDPRPHGGVEARQGDVGRDDEHQRGARRRPRGPAELNAMGPSPQHAGAARRALVAAAALAWVLTAQPSQAVEPPASGATTITNSIGIRLVTLPAGSFTMGSPPGAPLRQEEEATRQVTLTRSFRISATEVTRRQWTAVMGQGSAAGQDAELPVSLDLVAGRAGVLPEAVAAGGRHVSPADRGGVGVRLPRRRRRGRRRPRRQRLARGQQRRGRAPGRPEAGQRLGAVRHARQRRRVDPGCLRAVPAPSSRRRTPAGAPAGPRAWCEAAPSAVSRPRCAARRGPARPSRTSWLTSACASCRRSARPARGTERDRQRRRRACPAPAVPLRCAPAEAFCTSRRRCCSALSCCSSWSR